MSSQAGQPLRRTRLAQVQTWLRPLLGLLLVAGFVAAQGLAETHAHADASSHEASCTVCRILVDAEDGFTAPDLVITEHTLGAVLDGPSPVDVEVSTSVLAALSPRAPPLT